MSALGHKRTFLDVRFSQNDVCFTPKADILCVERDVRFVPIADITFPHGGELISSGRPQWNKQQKIGANGGNGLRQLGFQLLRQRVD